MDDCTQLPWKYDPLNKFAISFSLLFLPSLISTFLLISSHESERLSQGLLRKCKLQFVTSHSSDGNNSNSSIVRCMNANIWFTHECQMFDTELRVCARPVNHAGHWNDETSPSGVNASLAGIFHYGIFLINHTKTLGTYGVKACSVNISCLYLTSGHDFPESHNSSDCLPSKSNLYALSSISPTVQSSVAGRTQTHLDSRFCNIVTFFLQCNKI